MRWKCALKACIAKKTNQYDFPPPRKIVEDCYSHELEKLLKLADLDQQRNTDASAYADFNDNWLVATAWNESSRYKFWDQTQAEKLYNAVAEPSSGVLPWLKEYWYFYLVSKLADDKGISLAYRKLSETVRQIKETSLDLFEMKLIAPTTPLAQEVLDLQSRYTLNLYSQHLLRKVGPMRVGEAHIYPLASVT
jgi:hypothetical protein